MESSGSMAIQASISFGAEALSSFHGCAVTAAAWAARGRPPMPIMNPPAAVAMKWRRLNFGAMRVPCMVPSSGFQHVGGAMNGATQALVSSAAAYVGEVGVDFRIGRIGEVLQERDRGHDL